jgi:hypothetical protein
VRDGAHDDLGESGEREPDVQLRALEHQHWWLPPLRASKGNGNARVRARQTSSFFARLHASANVKILLAT